MKNFLRKINETNQMIISIRMSIKYSYEYDVNEEPHFILEIEFIKVIFLCLFLFYKQSFRLIINNQ